MTTQDYCLNPCIQCMDVAVQSDPSWCVAALTAKPWGAAWKWHKRGPKRGAFASSWKARRKTGVWNAQSTLSWQQCIECTLALRKLRWHWHVYMQLKAISALQKSQSHSFCSLPRFSWARLAFLEVAGSKVRVPPDTQWQAGHLSHGTSTTCLLWRVQQWLFATVPSRNLYSWD